MGQGPHTELLECLDEWYVGDYDSEQFYKLFNLEECNYIEFLFKEMINIFHLKQMMEWNAALKESKHQSSDYVITLVSFKPIESFVDDDDRRPHLRTTSQCCYGCDVTVCFILGMWYCTGVYVCTSTLVGRMQLLVHQTPPQNMYTGSSYWIIIVD